MSLKAFHIIFISTACAMSLGCGVWALVIYAGPDGRAVNLWSGLGAVTVSLALIAYEWYFLKKTKQVGYL